MSRALVASDNNVATQYVATRVRCLPEPRGSSGRLVVFVVSCRRRSDYCRGSCEPQMRSGQKNKATTVVAVAYFPQSDELMNYVLGFNSFAA